jgi:hypothetical protein
MRIKAEASGDIIKQTQCKNRGGMSNMLKQTTEAIESRGLEKATESKKARVAK